MSDAVAMMMLRQKARQRQSAIDAEYPLDSYLDGKRITWGDLRIMATIGQDEVEIQVSPTMDLQRGTLVFVADIDDVLLQLRIAERSSK